MKRIKVILCTFFILMSLTVSASNDSYFRDFWYPTYHINALNYCTLNKAHCGRKVADRYCQLMGYPKADTFRINHNVGYTHYIDSRATCLGCRCDGFTWIRCMKPMIHQPVKTYYYRFRQFINPRYEGCRVDWCYREGQGCGAKPAHSFCRRMGYLKASDYQVDLMAYKTKTLGNHVLCFGKKCKAFRTITCYR